MKREVKAGVNFLKRLIVARGKLNETKVELFAEKLQKLLCDQYEDHWYPDCPSKGQAYRCIRINNSMLCDKVILRACAESELTPTELCLPAEITVWIDPLEVCVRSGENSRPFTIASFNGEEEEDEESVKGEQHSINLDTSDYHSATSSDCGSTASSDTEEEAKDGEMEGEQEKEEKEVAKKDATESDPYTIVMVPRIRKRHGEGPNKTKYVRNLIPASLQYYYHPAAVWPQYKKATPVFLTTLCTPPAPPPPPQQVFGYYILPQPSPQFIVPQASLQTWGAVKG
ncbi:protein BTG4 [Echeneis naucrates]|uniref:Protein BTG4-like n=1 Tax=Echeneis naucrates TaxID=173247 RepID=A0A665T7B2_ECHNA|nr:protein BTG4-like [Echeneis naucrates]